jgi:hypothetical protein
MIGKRRESGGGIVANGRGEVGMNGESFAYRIANRSPKQS